MFCWSSLVRGAERKEHQYSERKLIKAFHFSFQFFFRFSIPSFPCYLLSVSRRGNPHPLECVEYVSGSFHWLPGQNPWENWSLPIPCPTTVPSCLARDTPSSFHSRTPCCRLPRSLLAFLPCITSSVFQASVHRAHPLRGLPWSPFILCPSFWPCIVSHENSTL